MRHRFAALVIVALGLVAPVWLAAQINGPTLTEPLIQWFDASGDPLSGGKLCTYVAGTSTPLATYTDALLTTPHANPIILSSAGRPAVGATETPVYLSDRAYKFILKTAGADSTCSTGTTLWTVDNYVGRMPPATVLSKSADYVVAVTDGKDVLVAADASGGSFTVTLYTASGNSGRIIRVIKTDTSTGTVTVDGHLAETINGATTYLLRTQYDGVDLISNGTNWLILSTNAQLGDLAAGGRLTLSSTLAVTTADVIGAGTIYYLPHVHNRIALYDGSRWNTRTWSSINISPTCATGTNHDVFVFDNAGVPALELTAWTNDTTRATALVQQDGVWVKSGTLTRRYLGTARCSNTDQVEDSAAKRFLWNAYNRVVRPMAVTDPSNSWNYTLATWRQANAAGVGTANQLALVVGQAGDAFHVTVVAQTSHSAGGTSRFVGIGEDSTTTPLSGARTQYADQNTGSLHALSIPVPAVGYHFYAWLEYSEASGTTTWIGDNGGTLVQTGIFGLWSS